MNWVFRNQMFSFKLEVTSQDKNMKNRDAASICEKNSSYRFSSENKVKDRINFREDTCNLILIY